MRIRTCAFFVGLMMITAASCATPYRIEAPESFKQYRDTREFKLITADGVMLKGREVENYPIADLDFWVDALARHLEQRGYAPKERNCFITKEGLAGCTLDFVVPHGAEDWVLSETVFVDDDRIILLEAAGPYERFSAVEKELRAALETFSAGN